MHVIVILIALLISFEVVNPQLCYAKKSPGSACEQSDLLSDDEVRQVVDETISSLKQEYAWEKRGKAGARVAAIPVAAMPLAPPLQASSLHPFIQPLTSLQTLRRVAKTTVEMEFSAEVAGNSFGSSNGREDLASRIFGKKDIQVQDIALVTRLAAKGGILADLVGGVANLVALQNIATEPVVFNALTHREQLHLGASAAFFEEKLRFTIGLPVAVGTNQLRVDNDGALKDKVRTRLNALLDGDFANDTLSEFIDKLVGSMGMKTGERVTIAGLGQASVGVMYTPFKGKMKHIQLGVQAFLPTAPNPDVNRVWSVELAPNNLAFGVSGLFSYAHNRYLNPYVQADGRINTTSKAPRRVSRIVSGDGVALPGLRMALGGFVEWAAGGGALGANLINESEAAVRGFSDFSSDVTWRLGNSLTLQVGNVFERVVASGGYLDCAYKLGVKVKDQVISVNPSGQYDTNVLTMNTNEVSHQVRLGYQYQFNDAFRLGVMSSLVFAGTNVPQVFGATALFGFSF